MRYKLCALIIHSKSVHSARVITYFILTLTHRTTLLDAYADDGGMCVCMRFYRLVCCDDN